MKFGIRTPSLKKSFKARTTGRAKRAIKKAVVPGYGKKGTGFIKNPKKAAYNYVYNRTTVGVNDILSNNKKTKKSNGFSGSSDSILILNRELDMLNDYAKVLSTTKNPEIFFSRYDLYIEKLTLLSEAEKQGTNFSGESPTKKLAIINTPYEKAKMFNDFIDRYWDDVNEKAKNLKTERGKENRLIKFQTILESYEDKMPEQSITYYKSKLGLCEYIEEYYPIQEPIQIDNPIADKNRNVLYGAIFGGWFGLHKYMRGKIGKGIIYSLTAGLFFFGWWHDIYVEYKIYRNSK